MTGDTTINLDNSIKRPSSPKHVEEPLICKKKSDNSLKKPSSLEYVKETPICKKKKSSSKLVATTLRCKLSI